MISSILPFYAFPASFPDVVLGKSDEKKIFSIRQRILSCVSLSSLKTLVTSNVMILSGLAILHSHSSGIGKISLSLLGAYILIEQLLTFSIKPYPFSSLQLLARSSLTKTQVTCLIAPRSRNNISYIIRLLQSSSDEFFSLHHQTILEAFLTAHKEEKVLLALFFENLLFSSEQILSPRKKAALINWMTTKEDDSYFTLLLTHVAKSKDKAFWKTNEKEIWEFFEKVKGEKQGDLLLEFFKIASKGRDWWESQKAKTWAKVNELQSGDAKNNIFTFFFRKHRENEAWWTSQIRDCCQLIGLLHLTTQEALLQKFLQLEKKDLSTYQSQIFWKLVNQLPVFSKYQILLLVLENTRLLRSQGKCFWQSTSSFHHSYFYDPESGLKTRREILKKFFPLASNDKDLWNSQKKGVFDFIDRLSDKEKKEATLSFIKVTSKNLPLYNLHLPTFFEKLNSIDRKEKQNFVHTLIKDVDATFWKGPGKLVLDWAYQLDASDLIAIINSSVKILPQNKNVQDFIHLQIIKWIKKMDRNPRDQKDVLATLLDHLYLATKKKEKWASTLFTLDLILKWIKILHPFYQIEIICLLTEKLCQDPIEDFPLTCFIRTWMKQLDDYFVGQLIGTILEKGEIQLLQSCQQDIIKRMQQVSPCYQLEIIKRFVRCKKESLSSLYGKSLFGWINGLEKTYREEVLQCFFESGNTTLYQSNVNAFLQLFQTTPLSPAVLTRTLLFSFRETVPQKVYLSFLTHSLKQFSNEETGDFLENLLTKKRDLLEIPLIEYLLPSLSVRTKKENDHPITLSLQVQEQWRWLGSSILQSSLFQKQKTVRQPQIKTLNLLTDSLPQEILKEWISFLPIVEAVRYASIDQKASQIFWKSGRSLKLLEHIIAQFTQLSQLTNSQEIKEIQEKLLHLQTTLSD